MAFRAALNIEDLHKIAKRRLPRVACEFLAGGEAGAAHAIDILRAGIDRVMALLGCPSIGELDTGYLLQ